MFNYCLHRTHASTQLYISFFLRSKNVHRIRVGALLSLDLLHLILRIFPWNFVRALFIFIARTYLLNVCVSARALVRLMIIVSLWYNANELPNKPYFQFGRTTTTTTASTTTSTTKTLSICDSKVATTIVRKSSIYVFITTKTPSEREREAREREIKRH